MADAPLRTFDFRLVSPESEVMSEPALAVTIPGTEGEFGVCPGHMNLISFLRPGVVSVQAAHHPNPVRFFIAGGFASVTGDSCTVLAEQAVDVLQMDPAAIAQEISRIEAHLQVAVDDGMTAQLQADLSLARARLAACEGVKKAA